MRFLADESCDYAAVRTLTGLGHEVLSVADLSLGADDEFVISLALEERCILITEDKDFGQLVYASGMESVGVILLRFPAGVRSGIGEAIAELVDREGEGLIARFAVVQPGRVRISRAPPS